MTTTELKERTAKLKEMTDDFMRGELTLTKLDFCLIGAVCFLAGICIGMLVAPLTQGIHILSHNTNNGSGNASKNGNNHNNQDTNAEDGGAL